MAAENVKLPGELKGLGWILINRLWLDVLSWDPDLTVEQVLPQFHPCNSPGLSLQPRAIPGDKLAHICRPSQDLYATC